MRETEIQIRPDTFHSHCIITFVIRVSESYQLKDIVYTKKFFLIIFLVVNLLIYLIY